MLLVLDSEDGALLWNKSIIAAYKPIIIGNDLNGFYVMTKGRVNNDAIISFNWDGSIRWELNISLMSKPIIDIYNNIIFALMSDRRLVAINMENGKVLWHIGIRSIYINSLAVDIDNKIVYILQLTNIVAYDGINGKVIWNKNLEVNDSFLYLSLQNVLMGISYWKVY